MAEVQVEPVVLELFWDVLGLEVDAGRRDAPPVQASFGALEGWREGAERLPEAVRAVVFDGPVAGDPPALRGLPGRPVSAGWQQVLCEYLLVVAVEELDGCGDEGCAWERVQRRGVVVAVVPAAEAAEVEVEHAGEGWGRDQVPGRWPGRADQAAGKAQVGEELGAGGVTPEAEGFRRLAGAE
jgi:hypothetical protein